MRLTLIALIVIALGTTIAHGIALAVEEQGDVGQGVKKVVESYRKLDMEGRWLGGEHADELQEFFIGPLLSTDFGDVIVVKSYSIGTPRRLVNKEGQAYYSVEITYLYWGSLDRWLVFRYAESAAPSRPARTVSVSSLSFTDKFHEVSTQTGSEVLKSVPPQWRIMGGTLDYVSVETAIRYLAQMRTKSNSAILSDNAEESIEELKSLSNAGSAPVSMVMAAESPVDTLRRVWELGRTGEGLTRQGWDEQARYFAMRPAWPWKRIEVIGNDPSTNFQARLNAVGDVADFTVSYAKVGYLDSSMSLKLIALAPCRVAPDYCVNEAAYSLRLSNKYWQQESDGSVKKFQGPLAWRIIEADPPVPWITVDVAIRYVTDIRDSTPDPTIKANAESALATLNHFR